MSVTVADPRSKRKILMVAADFPPGIGGVATYSLALARTLREAGYELDVVTSVPAGGPSPSGVPVWRTSLGLNRKYLKILPLALGTLRRCLRSRPDLLLLMKCNHEGVVGAMIKSLLGIPYVVAAYGSEVLAFQRQPLFGRFMTRVFQRSERVLVDSEYARGLVTDCGVDPDRVEVVHIGIDPVPETLLAGDAARDFRARFGLEGKRIMLTVSRLIKRKGHDRVAQALAILQDEFPDLVWVIVGDGIDRHYVERTIGELNLQDRVRMVGSRTAEEVDKFFRLSDLFVMASRQDGINVEGFGIAFVEAALRRLPVVAGRHGGVPEAVGEDESGILVDPENPSEIASAIRSLLEDPEAARRLGDRGHDRALREFDRGHQAARLRDLFETLVPRPDLAARGSLR